MWPQGELSDVECASAQVDARVAADAPLLRDWFPEERAAAA